MGDVLEQIQPRDSLGAQQSDGVGVWLLEDRSQQVAAVDLLLLSALAVNHGVLEHAVKCQGLPALERLVSGNTLDGSVLNAVLEVPSFLALLCELQEGEVAVTNDIFVQQLRPVSGGTEVMLEGRLIRRGRRMAWTEAQACVDGKVCALARITKTLLASS